MRDERWEMGRWGGMGGIDQIDKRAKRHGGVSAAGSGQGRAGTAGVRHVLYLLHTCMYLSLSSIIHLSHAPWGSISSPFLPAALFCLLLFSFSPLFSGWE